MTDAYRIVFHCLDQNQKLLAEQVTFSFIGTWFGIDPTSNLVHYLKITIDTVEALSLLHLFLWQHRQGLMLRSNIQLIIIQDELEASNTAVTEYWRNLASLSLQMGFSTVSFISYSDIGYYKPTNQIIIVSQLLRIDTQQLDTMAGLSQFRFDGKMSTLMKSIVLQRIGLTVHEERKYAHLLPMILGYSAYLIYEEMEKQGVIQRYVTAQVDAIYEVSYSQQVYTDLIIPDSFKNFFELPVHLLKIFGFDDTNKFIFQQMCDVSYLFKAQYFAVFSAFFPLDNAVLSQSSRSGKTVTLHTIFYFNLFSGIKIPILINTGFTKDSRELETQPLYDRTSIEIGEGIRALFCEYQSKTDLGDVISSNLKDGVEYSKTMAYVKAECFNLIKTYDMHTAQQQLKGAFELYLQGTSVFCEFSVTGLLDFFKFDQNKQLEQTTKFLNDEIQASANKLKAAKKIIGTLNQEDSIQNQKDVIRAIEQQIELLKQRKASYRAYKTQPRSISVQSYNSNKEVILLVDECLSQQKASYALCTSALVGITDQFVVKFMEKAKSSIDEILNKIDDISVNYLIQLLDWLQIRQNGLIVRKIDYYDTPQYLEYAKKKLESILLDPTEIERYFLTLIPSELFKNCKAYKIIDLMGISSPNFINLRQPQIVREQFQEMMLDARKLSTLEVFREKIYQFLLMMYNPRGVETIFWLNVSYFINQHNRTTSLNTPIDVTYKLNEYFREQFDTENQYTDFFKNTYDVKITFPQKNVYEEVPFTSKNTVHLLTAGTDISIVNFIGYNQSHYTSYNSRGSNIFTESNILGTSQMHSSCLTQRYYQGMQIAALTDDSMIQYVKKQVQGMDIKDFYLTTVPELAAELQFLCPLVCPQIIINEGANAYFFNSTQQFELTINSKSIPLHQISSHMQIHNSLFIMRDEELVGVNQRINQKRKQVLFEPQEGENFNKYLHLTSSSTLNRDVVFVLHFLASQRFLDTLTMLNGESDQAQLSQLCTTGQIEGLLKQQQISEISSAIILVISLCRQYPTHMSGLTKLFKQVITYSQYLEIYMNPLQVQQNNIPTLKEIYAQFQSLFKGAFFMFLQKSFDKYWHCTTPDINIQVGEAIQNASVCYVKLKQLGLLQEDEKLAIVTITDKTCILNLFVDTSPLMPDYLISLFGVEDTIRDLFSNKSMLSIQAHEVEGKKISSINLLMDSGNHTGEELFEKQKDTGIATCLHVTNKYQQNFNQICLHHQVSPQYEARTEKVEAYQAQKEAEVLSEVKAKVEQLNNDVAQANDKVVQLKNEVDEAEAELTTAKAKVNQAEAELTTAKLNTSKPNIDAKNIVIQYEKRQEYAMLNAVQEIEKAEKALLYAQYASVSPRKQFNIEQAEIQLQQAKDWQQTLTENTNEDNDIAKAAIKAQAEFELLQAKYDSIVRLEAIKHLAERLINANQQIELLTQNQTEATNMTATVKQRVEDAQTDLTSKQIISKEREGSVNAAMNTLNILKEILKKEKELQSTTQEKTTLLIEQASKEFEQVQENAKQPTADTLVATQKHQSAVAYQSFVDKMLTCIKGELLLGEKSQKDVQIQIGKQSTQDQVEIQDYMDLWNQAIGLQTPTNESETSQEDVGLSVLDQQLAFDMLELCQLFDQLSQSQLAKESKFQQQIVTASKYAVLSVPLLTEQYNQVNDRKVLQQPGGATPNQVKVMSKEEIQELQNLISEWCTNVLEKGQQAEIEIIDVNTYWNNLFGLPQIIVHFGFKVLLGKIKQLLQQLKVQQKIQDKNTISPYGTKNTTVLDYLQELKEKEQQQESKQLFNDKFFRLDIFYFVNCKRNNTSSMFCIDYLRNIENQTVKKIIQQIDLIYDQQNKEEPAKQQIEVLSQDDVEKFL